MNIKELRIEYFPNNLLAEVFDHEEANNMLNSKASTAWANGPIKGTEWTKLAEASPTQKGDKTLVIVCKTALLTSTK